MAGRRGAALALVLAACPPTAAAESLGELHAAEPVARACAGELLRPGTPGTARAVWGAPADGTATVRLDGGRAPDWDLALFRDGRPIAASTSFTSTERASVPVEAGDRLRVQACRRDGPHRTVPLSVGLHPPAAEPADRRVSLVSVPVASAAEVARLERLGLDVTHDVGGGEATVVTYSAAERARLAAHGFEPRTLVRDLAVASAADRASERRAVGPSRLPSGRTSYRQYADYTSEMKALAAANPSLVRSIQIGTTLEARPIEGVEIAENVAATDDGRPVYLNFGAHHAREWPSAEMPMEFALDLVARYNAADPRVQALLADVRVVIVPVVNVDGFIVSRGMSSPEAENRRKNCRPTLGDAAIACALRLSASGVDLNRNYGAYWGGPGSSGDPSSSGYRGSAPFSEPESQAVREYTASVHPTVFITNHTFTTDGKWLRQPGFDAAFLPADGIGALTPDEAAMKALGDAMGAANGYASERSFETLGNITGATEDWNYFAQGTYGYTPEARGTTFHGVYADAVVEEYDGGVLGNPLGTDEAYLIAGELAANPVHHGVLTGTAPPGATLRLRKQFPTPTCDGASCFTGNGPAVTDTLDTRLTAPADGTYEWHVNPSGRPLHPSETWTMSCQVAGLGEVSAPVAVGRGQAVTVDWAEPCANAPPGGATKRCRGKPATIVGTSAGERLRGTSGADVIFARGGGDRIDARGGADLVCAGGGADRARGGAGADRLFGGPGADRLAGGPGRDKCGDATGRDKARSCS